MKRGLGVATKKVLIGLEFIPKSCEYDRLVEPNLGPLGAFQVSLKVDRSRFVRSFEGNSRVPRTLDLSNATFEDLAIFQVKGCLEHCGASYPGTQCKCQGGGYLRNLVLPTREIVDEGIDAVWWG